MEVVEKAKRAMTFVLLQEAACSIPQGFLLQQRRDVVFSQAVGDQTDIIIRSEYMFDGICLLFTKPFTDMQIFRFVNVIMQIIFRY